MVSKKCFLSSSASFGCCLFTGSLSNTSNNIAFHHLCCALPRYSNFTGISCLCLFWSLDMWRHWVFFALCVCTCSAFLSRLSLSTDTFFSLRTLIDRSWCRWKLFNYCDGLENFDRIWIKLWVNKFEAVFHDEMKLFGIEFNKIQAEDLQV